LHKQQLDIKQHGHQFAAIFSGLYPSLKFCVSHIKFSLTF